MSEYWKSIPKKLCDVCNVWFQDNRASIEHHERGLRHKANVQKKLHDIRRRGAVQQKEQQEHSSAIMQIEAAALNSFQADVASNPSLAGQLAHCSSLSQLPVVHQHSSGSSGPQKGRFGEDFVVEEKRELVRGRERALQTIADKLHKKSRWLEAKTSDGDVYYWNRDTYESMRDKPKDGFLTIAEQEGPDFGSTVSGHGSESTSSVDSKFSPYGRWTHVEDTSLQMPDLQLPVGDAADGQVEAPIPLEEKSEGTFEEKVLEKKISSGYDSFKKRRIKTASERNVRKRDSSP